jgi:hypothetical protein
MCACLHHFYEQVKVTMWSLQLNERKLRTFSKLETATFHAVKRIGLNAQSVTIEEKKH